MFLVESKPDILHFFSFQTVYEHKPYFYAIPLHSNAYQYAESLGWKPHTGVIPIPSIDQYSYAIQYVPSRWMYTVYVQIDSKLVPIDDCKEEYDAAIFIQSISSTIPVILAKEADTPNKARTYASQLKKKPVFIVSNPNRKDTAPYLVFSVCRISYADVVSFLEQGFSVMNELQIKTETDECITVIPKVAIVGYFANVIISDTISCQTPFKIDRILRDRLYLLPLK